MFLVERPNKDRLKVGEGVEGVISMVGTHPTVPHTPEGQVVVWKEQKGMVESLVLSGGGPNLMYQHSLLPLCSDK